MEPVSKWSVGTLLTMIRPFVGVALIGLVLRAAYRAAWPASDLAHLLADALVVGAVIGVTLEWFASRRLIDAAARELSERLVGEGLPKPLQAAIAEVVHQTAIVIDHATVRYRITSIPADPAHVEVTIERSYRATNYGRSDVSYRPVLAEEHFHSPVFLSLHCDGGIGAVYSLDAAELQKRTTPQPGSQVRTVAGDPSRLRPHLEDPERSRCLVKWVYRLRTPSNYSDVISFGKPSLDYTVICDEKPYGFEFVASDDAQWTEHTDRQWVYRKAFLSKQHIRVWWSRDPLIGPSGS